MKSPNDYIVQFKETHQTTTTVGDCELTVNPMFEQPKWINRVGIVIATPPSIDTPIQKGYEVLVVHTVLLDESFIKQGKIENPFLADKEKGYYRFEPSLIVMYREDDKSEWKCNNEYIMVLPIEIDTIQKEWNGLDIPDMVYENEQGYKGNENQKGTIAYDNPKLNEKGIYKGDEIIFKVDREYEFELDGKTYWNMENNDILLYNPKNRAA